MSSTTITDLNTSISYKQASIGVLSAIAIGYSIFLITYFLGFASLFSAINQKFLGDASFPNYMYIVSLSFAFVTDIPACFGWLFGGLILGIYSKRKNADFNGVKGSWKSFKIVIMAFELIFIGSFIYYLIAILVDPNLLTFFGGFMIYFLTFLFTPGFFLSGIFVLLGGFFGSKYADRFSELLNNLKLRISEKKTE